MQGDSFCIQYTNCTGCPKAVENILIYRNLPKGEHIPKDKCTQNCMLFMIRVSYLSIVKSIPEIHCVKDSLSCKLLVPRSKY